MSVPMMQYPPGVQRAASLKFPGYRAVRAKRMRGKLSEFVKEAWKIIEPSTPLIWSWHLDVICDHVQALLEGRLAKNNLAICVPPGSMKPVDENTYVVEKRRGYTRLKTIVVGERVLTHTGTFKRVSAVHVQGVLPTLTILTAKGRKLCLAPDHPVLTTSGWKLAEKITPSDVLAEVHPIEEFGTQTISNEEARLLAYLIGDGCLPDNATARFCNADTECMNDFVNCAASLKFKTSHISKRGKSVTRSILKVRPWLEKHKLVGKSSYTKRVPRAVLAGNAEIAKHFLAAYWACDGGIHDRRDLPRSKRVNQKVQTIRIYCSTVSERLAFDVQFLLQRLGISFTFRKKIRKLQTQAQGAYYTSYEVHASDQHNVAKFMQIVAPFIHHEKKSRAKNTAFTKFQSVLNADPVVAVKKSKALACRCLSVEEDHSFVANGLAVHNSTIVSVCAPAWWWIDHPAWRGTFASGNEDVATRDSMKCRELLSSQWYRDNFNPTWTFAKDQNAKRKYQNTATGFRSATTTKTKITGARPTDLFVDDPLDVTETYSKPARDQVISWWGAAGNRLANMVTGKRCIIMQRLHEEDLVGYVSSLEPDEWEVLIIPQEWDERLRFTSSLGWTDPRTVDGELMFPERFPERILKGERLRLGSSGYQGQHQQRPSAAEGEIFKRGHAQFVYPESIPAKAIEQQIISWDTAVKEAQQNDWSVSLVGVKFDKGVLIRAETRIKTGYPGLKEAAKLQASQFKISALVIEDKQSGQQLIQELRQDTDLPVVAIQVNRDKVARAWPCVPYWEADRIFFPCDARGIPEPWVEPFLTELYTFPKATHDDRVDAFTQMITYLILSGGGTGLVAWYKQKTEEMNRTQEASRIEDAKVHKIDYVKLLGAR
jgi:predicted phage terminase large subunit-like protein